MGEKRREKNRLTKESMLKLMNKTKEDFKTNGASIQDMVPVFEHYGIQVRIFNSFIKRIFKYPLTKYNHHIPTLNALVKKTTSTRQMIIYRCKATGGNPRKSRCIG